MKRSARRDDVDGVAASWAVRLENGDLSDVERHDLEAWLERDVRHVGALVRAQTVWMDLDRVAALRAGALPLPQPRPRLIDRLLQRPQIPALAACAALLVIGLTTLAGYQYFDGRLVANRGEVRRVALDDGSTVILNSASVVQVKFSHGERTVFLRSGEASFQVAHDTARPFVVHARDLSVRAVGTSFAVRLEPAKVSVTVAEGVVAVKRQSSRRATPELQLVRRDAELTAAPSQPLTTVAVSEAEITRRLAWREGLLVFSGEGLAQASAEVNRYAAHPVIIDDPKLRSEAFIGVFRLGDSKAFAASAAAAYDDQVIDAGDGLHIAARGNLTTE